MERKHQDYFFIIEVKKGCNKYDMERSIDEYPLVYVHLVNVYNKWMKYYKSLQQKTQMIILLAKTIVV